jgi:CheY-like chemotaxis protein
MLDLILCIDDDPIALMLCKKVVIKASFSNEITTALNGEEALKYFNTIKYNISKDKAKKHPQVIFLDLNMPVMGGWEFLNLFNTPDYSEFHSTKVIILSSTIDPEDLEKSKTYPMVIDFLSKPITTAMLESLKKEI